MTRDDHYLTLFVLILFLDSDSFPLKPFPLLNSKLLSPRLHIHDSLPDSFLWDGVEQISDLLLEVLNVGGHGLVDQCLHEPPEAEVTGIHVRKCWRPEHALSGFKSKHPVSKDSVKPVHDNVCFMRLCSVLLPDGLVEPLRAQPPLDHGDHLVD